MAVRIDGLDDARRALRRLSADVKGQAVANGLNRTALAVERRLKIEMARSLDRPTPFTLNATGRFRARPNRPRAGVFVKDIQARYLRWAVQGGRLPSVLTPISIRLDQHGNIRGKRGGLEKIASMGRRRFVAKINGTLGVWERHGPGGRRLKLLVRADRDSRREPRWDFFAIAERVTQERLARDLREAIDAVASRR